LIRFSKAFQYIENNLHSELSLEKLSEIENLSKGYFSDQFFEYTGVRPTEYIAQKRETKARELLTTTSMPLPEIACRIGIPDPSYFFRFFKKRVGVTARKYRLDHLPSQLSILHSLKTDGNRARCFYTLIQTRHVRALLNMLKPHDWSQ